MAKRACPNGHTTKDDKALKCSICGADLPPVSKRKLKPLVIALIAIGGLLFLCVIASMFAAPKRTQTGESANTAAPTLAQSNTPKPSPAPTNTATPKPIAKLTFGEIRANKESMTDAQWDNYCKPLIGQRVQWTGWVDEAKDKGNHGELWIDMDSPDEVLSLQDLYFDVPKEDVLKYNKDQKVTFEGDINSISTFLTSLQIRMEDVLVIK